MAKTQEELNTLREEYKTISSKLKELTDDEIEVVYTGVNIWVIVVKQKDKFNITSGISAHGNNGKPTLSLWDEVFSGLITDTED